VSLTCYYCLLDFYLQKALCQTCKNNNAVLPAMESFRQRHKIPKIYALFYLVFVKGLMGDNTWDLVMLTTDADGKGEGTPQHPKLSPTFEAFLMFLLENNYFAWYMDFFSNVAIEEYDEMEVMTQYKTDTGLFACVSDYVIGTGIEIGRSRLNESTEDEASDDDDDNEPMLFEFEILLVSCDVSR